MIISVSIKSLQNINYFNFEIDLSSHNLACITGRNGVGKTAIIKSIGLLYDVGLLGKTSSIYSISEKTKIEIKIDEKSYRYHFNGSEIDSRDVVDKGLISVELPIPYGKRFSIYPSLGRIDKELREKYIKGEVLENEEIISFLSSVYVGDKFRFIKEVRVKGDVFYFLPLDNYKYIREDYFSSGEFFVINLYKMILSDCKLIIIDEIDISYAFVMGELFGFLDYDKYILTEDMMLEKYIKKVLLSIETNKKIKIIYIGGASNTNDLMKRNRREEFICNGDSMITILDGDSKEKEKGDRVYYSPFLDIEDEVFRKYNSENHLYDIPSVAPTNAKSKFFCKKLIEVIGIDRFFDILEGGFDNEVREFKMNISNFVNS